MDPRVKPEDDGSGCCARSGPSQSERRCHQRRGKIATGKLAGRDQSPNHMPLPPHLPLATLKLPQDMGLRQSEIRSLESGR